MDPQQNPVRARENDGVGAKGRAAEQVGRVDRPDQLGEVQRAERVPTAVLPLKALCQAI
jgi:hypothetical protein